MLKCIMFPLDVSHFSYRCFCLQLLIKSYAIKVAVPRFVKVVMSNYNTNRSFEYVHYLGLGKYPSANHNLMLPASKNGKK